MKKLYCCLALMLCALYSLTIGAQTTTEEIDIVFCVIIDDPSLCYVQDSNGERVDLVKGENIFTTTLRKTTYNDGSVFAISDGIYLYIEDDKQADYRIMACDIEVGGVKSAWDRFRGVNTSMYISFDSEDMNGCTLYPTISNLDELRTATATVIVDDASKVRVDCGSNGYTLELTNGENIVRFDPVNEAVWSIGAKDLGKYLGGVVQNGSKVTETYGRFKLNVAEGDKIEITAEASAEPVAVKITGNTEAVKNVYTFSYPEKNEIEYWQDGFEVAPRTQIIVTLDRNTYNITSLIVNGQTQSVYSDDVYIAINDATEIVVTAEKYSTFSLPLEITDPAHINVKVAESQYGNSTELTDLTAGLQTLEISSKNTYMIVNVNDGFVIDKVAYIYKGEETEVEFAYGGYYIPLEGTEKVVVVSSVEVVDDIDLVKVSYERGKTYNMIGVEVKGTSLPGMYIVNGKKHFVGQN